MAIIALTKAIRLGRRYSRVHGWYSDKPVEVWDGSAEQNALLTSYRSAGSTDQPDDCDLPQQDD